ncbi:MAG: 2-hydroxyacid dehydrogenase [Vampirovibrionia bacterium]
MVKVAFFDSKIYDEETFNKINENYNFKLSFFKDKLSHETVSLTKNFDIVCVFVNDNIDSDVISKLLENNVKLIALRCAGYNNVDLKNAYKNINVVRVPAYSPYAVAEHAVALMLTLNRKIHKAYNRTRENNFTLNGLMGFDMHNKTIGVIGTGKIGKTLINILRGFNMNILAYDVFPDKDFEKESGVKYVDLMDIYKRSDIISLNCPLTKDTFHLINYDSISLMKKNVMIINTSRGKLIDTSALIDALKEQKIGSAGLDVYEEESEYFFEDFSSSFIEDDLLARLLSFNNVIITSHQGFFTFEALTNIAETTLQNIKDFIDNKPLVNEICYRCDSICVHKTKGRCF